MKNQILIILWIISLFSILFVSAQETATEIEANATEVICIPRTIAKYTCPDGSKVEWCVCEEGGLWVCANSPETNCPTTKACNIPACEGAYPTGKYYDDGCPVYACPIEECSPGTVKKYTCPDGTKVDWCTCGTGGTETCVASPETQCPQLACEEPVCKDGSKPYFTGETKNGCKIYACPEIVCDKLGCKDNAEPHFTGKYDENNCPIYVCPGITCQVPVCDEGVDLYFTGDYDKNNCPIYRCSNIACEMPVCRDGNDSYLTGKYDIHGCPIYECPQLVCALLGCKEGQESYFTGKYDNNGCPIYECCPEDCICSGNVMTCPIIPEPVETEVAIGPGEVELAEGVELSKTNAKTISIEKIGDKFFITTEEVIAITAEKLIVEESKLYIKTSAGNKQVKILPEEAYSIAAKIATVEEIELKEEDAKPIYHVKGTKRAKIFFIIPASIKVEVKIDAKTGEVVSVNKKSWWSFLTW